MLTPLYGLDRRDLLRAAAAGVVAATMPKFFSAAGQATIHRPVGFGKAKSVLIVRLSGGPCQLDTLDPKLDASADNCSTIFDALGVDSGATLFDPLDRPHHLLNGNVISNLYTGVTA